MYLKDSNLFNETLSKSVLEAQTFYPSISLSNFVNQTILTILSRLGFVLVQIGAVPRINVNFIILENILDICCTTVAYFTLGFVAILNGDLYSFIYGDYYRFKDFPIRKDEILIGWQTAVIASGIYTSNMIGRTHVICHFLVSVLLAGLIQPLFIRWTWMPQGWIAKSSLNGVKVVYRDRAGSGIVHVVGGLTGFIVSLILSRKNKTFTNDESRIVGKVNVISFYTGTGFFGLFLIFVSLQTFSIPVLEVNVSKTVDIVINNLLAASSCTLLVMMLHFTLRRPIDHWTTIRCVQALIAGSIMISAAADKYSCLMSIALGCSGGAIFYLVSRLIFFNELEDHCNIITTHLVCGFLANVLAPLCIFEIESDNPSVLLNFSWQLISLIILMGLVIVTLIPVFLILDTCGLLRQQFKVLNTKEITNIFEMKEGLSDKNINYDQHRSMLYTKRIISMKSCKSYKSHNELPKTEERKFTKENHAATEGNIRNEKSPEMPQPSDGRVRKLRHVYTLPGYDFTSPQDHLADGDGIDINLSDNKKPLSETDLQDSKLTFHSTENVNSGEISITNNYRLRRTQKCMNLREELDKQDIDGYWQRKESDNSLVDDTYVKMISVIDTCNKSLRRVTDLSSL